jgi:translation initiation factor IF-2
VLRANEEIFSGKFSSLKKFKEDVSEIQSGSECGIAISNFKNIHVADIIECFEVQKVARRL